jgi:ApaG protein
METLTTNGITISVETFYQPKHSNPREMRFVFAYRITIENHSPNTVQLLRRHWYITDSAGQIREVEGEGVVGKQPVLKPEDLHQYVSWCPLTTDIGMMHGTFLMQNTETGDTFHARIPAFKLIAPFKLN